MTDNELKDKASTLAREAVQKEMSRHLPVMSFTVTGPRHFCTVCWNDCGQLMWPCPTVETLSEADEAIAELEAAEEHEANGPYYCGVQTRGVRYVDPEPAEFCDAEVEDEDERCPAHQEPDDDYDHERYKESRYDD